MSEATSGPIPFMFNILRERYDELDLMVFEYSSMSLEELAVEDPAAAFHILNSITHNVFGAQTNQEVVFTSGEGITITTEQDDGAAQSALLQMLNHQFADAVTRGVDVSVGVFGTPDTPGGTILKFTVRPLD